MLTSVLEHDHNKEIIMSAKTTPVTPELDDYLHSKFSAEDEILRKVLQNGISKGLPNIHISGNQALFMQFILKAIGAKYVLEIGSLAGYSAIAMAKALPDDGKLIAVEINPDYAEVIKENAEMAGVSHKIEVVCQDGRQFVENCKFEHELDFVFVDADKPGYYLYLQKLTPFIRKGGIFAADNAFAFGYILDSAPERDPNEIKSIKSFNEKFLADENYFVTLVPIGDGLIMGLKL